MVVNTKELHLSMRIAEYNLQANNFFGKNVLFGEIEKQKELTIERERLVIAVLNSFPVCKLGNLLRKAKFTEIDGKKTKNVTSDLKEIVELLHEHK